MLGAKGLLAVLLSAAAGVGLTSYEKNWSFETVSVLSGAVGWAGACYIMLRLFGWNCWRVDAFCWLYMGFGALIGVVAWMALPLTGSSMFTYGVVGTLVLLAIFQGLDTLRPSGKNPDLAAE